MDSKMAVTEEQFQEFMQQAKPVKEKWFKKISMKGGKQPHGSGSNSQVLTPQESREGRQPHAAGVKGRPSRTKAGEEERVIKIKPVLSP